MPAGNKAKMTLFLSLIFPLYAGAGLWAADVLAGTRAASPEGSLPGSFFLLLGILTAFPFYFISFFPLGKLLGSLRSTQPVRALVYSAAAGLGGCWLLSLKDSKVWGRQRSPCVCRARSPARYDGELSGKEIRRPGTLNGQKGRLRRIIESGLPRMRRSGLFCRPEGTGNV